MEEKKYYGAQPKVTDDFDKIQDWLRLCVRKWHWFVVSILIALAFAVAYIITKQPIYSRTASVILKDDAKSSSLSSQFGQFSSMGLAGGRTNLYNEMITFRSPTYMQDVVVQLHLDMNYMIKGTFHDHVLYGKNLPISVTLPSLQAEESARLSVKLEDNEMVTLSDFYKGGDEIDHNKAIKGKMGTLIETPIGVVKVDRTTAYAGKSKTVIYVSKSALDDAAKSYAGRLTATLAEQRASVINLSIEDVSAQRAEDVLATLFKVYNQKWIDDINQQADATSVFIDDELRQIEAELGLVDNDISTFQSQNMVPNLQQATELAMRREESTGNMLMELNNQLFMAKYIRKQLSDEASKYKILPANSGIDNGSVSQQIMTYNEKLAQRNSMVSNSSTSNPLVKDIDQQLAATRQAIIASLDNAIVTINNRIADLTVSKNETKTTIAKSPSQARYLLSVERQQKVKEQLYIFLLQKKEENQLSKAYTAYVTKMINPPAGSKRPAKPVKLAVLFIAVSLGILIPLVFLFIMSNMDTVVHNRKDIESLSLPFIGEIPLSYKKYSGLLSIFNRRKEVREIVVKDKSGNPINEAFRVVRTNLEFVLGKESECKVLMFTSSFAGSGKTYISANLATSFAIKNKKTLLVDLDLRKGSLSTFVGTPNRGISDFLSGHVDNIDEVMVKGSINPNLDTIPVGTTPPNPTELLFNEKLTEMMEEMRTRYDYIIIDCPPLEVVADASIINKMCDMTVFVIRSGLFDKSLLPDIEKLYQEERYKNMAVILNGTYDEGLGYGYHGYGYGGYATN